MKDLKRTAILHAPRWWEEVGGGGGGASKIKELHPTAPLPHMVHTGTLPCHVSSAMSRTIRAASIGKAGSCDRFEVERERHRARTRMGG